MPTQIEQLPSEIWFHTFSYFEGHELIRLFSHLNSFIDSLLHSKYLHLHLRIRQGESNERLTEWIWSEINRENIFSLNFVTRKANCLIQFLRWNALSLTHLSTLSVYLKQSSSSYNIPYLIIALGQMPSLNRLRIKYRSRLNSNNCVYAQIVGVRYIVPLRPVHKHKVFNCGALFRLFPLNRRAVHQRR